jgi:hypothetical protein
MIISSLSNRFLDRFSEERLSNWGAEREPSESGAGRGLAFRGCKPHGPEARVKGAPPSWHGLPGRECKPHGQDARVDEHLAVVLFPSFGALGLTIAKWAEGRETNGRITLAGSLDVEPASVPGAFHAPRRTERRT